MHNWQVISWFKDKDIVFTLISVHLGVSLRKKTKKLQQVLYSLNWSCVFLV